MNQGYRGAERVRTIAFFLIFTIILSVVPQSALAEINALWSESGSQEAGPMVEKNAGLTEVLSIEDAAATTVTTDASATVTIDDTAVTTDAAATLITDDMKGTSVTTDALWSMSESYNQLDEKTKKMALEYLDTVKKLKTFSDATEEERTLICNYLNIDFDVLLKAETKGYSIADGLRIAVMVSKGDISFEEIEEGLAHYESVMALDCAIRNYSNVVRLNAFKEKTNTSIKQRVLKGSNAYDLQKPARVAEAFNVALESIINNANQESLNELKPETLSTEATEEMAKLSQFAFENDLSMSWVKQYAQEKQLDSEELKSGLNGYLGIPAEEALISDSKATEALEAAEPFLSAASTENPEEDKFRAPYSYEEYSEDKIEMNTGNLVFENKDIYLPGKNGLDFTLISRYNSENDRRGEEEIIEGAGYNKLYNVRIMFDVANNGLILYKNQVRSTKTGLTQEEYERLLDIYNNVAYDDKITYEADYDGDGSIDHFVFWLQEISQTVNSGSSVYVQTSYYTPTYSQKDSPLGTGWGFAFDSIELPTDESHEIIPLGKTALRIKKFDGVKYLHLKSGETYTIGSNLELEGYNLSDMRLEQSTAYTNGQGIASAYVLVYKDGLRKYFANDGRFLAEVDRYGNRIEYQHTIIEGHPVITKIIDSLNRVVTIYYDFSNNRVVVTAPDNKTITYVLSLSPGEYIKSPRDHSLIYTYSYTLSKRIDSENQEMSFEYGYTADLSYMTYRAVADRSKTILSKITYPTGAYVQYYYGNSKRFLPGGGQENYPSVRKRLIYEPKNKIKNETFYIYTNNYTRYPYTYDEKDEYQLRARFPEAYGFTEYDKNLEANMCYEHTFDYKNLLTSEETYRTFQTRGEGDFYKYAEKYYLYDTIGYKYGSDHQLLQSISKTYTVPPEVGMTQDTSKYLTSVEDYSFDNSRNLVKYWGPEAVRDGNNHLTNPNGDSQLVTYAYDTGGYHLVTSKQYKKDASTTLLETYGLTSDRKAVASVTIKQNGAQKSKTAYVYDQWGNVTSKKQYLEGGGSWTEYLEELYSYADDNTVRNGQFNGGYLTRKWTVGVKDADGTLVAARSGLSAGTVDYRYSYDNYGRVIETYDGQGEKTTQQYDSLGRIVSLRNPDGAQKLYAYDNINNILTLTDENGNQFQYLYDGLGNLLYEKDVATGRYLKTYKYNTRLLLEEETNNKNGANYYKIQYTYYDDGRIRRTETKDKNNVVLSVETLSYSGAYDRDGNGTPDCSLVVKTTEGEDTAPSIVTKTYTDRQGLVVKASTVHNGQEYQNTATYDYLGNKLSEKSARAYAEGWSESTTARYEYDYAGRVTKTYTVNGDYATAAYDALGRKITVTDIKGNKASTPYSTTYTYDSLGRVLSEQIPFEDVSGTLTYTLKKYFYDRNNNLLTSKTSNSLPGQTLAYSKTGYGYDKNNRLVHVTAYNGDIPENYTQYYYDAAGNKLRMYTGLSQPLTLSGPDTATGSDKDYSVTKYAYDRFGQLIEMTDSLGQKETYTYDLNGNQTAKTDRNGNVAAFSYDGLGRLTAKSVVTPDGKGNASYSYAYNKLGQIKTMADGATSTSYVYDDLGRVVKETGSDGITKEYTYDAENNRKTLVIKNNGTTVKNATYTYDKFNRLSQVSEDGQVQATYTYDANGNRASLTYPSGNTISYQYNLGNQLKTLTNLKGSTTLSQYTYDYYLDGNQYKKTETVTGTVTIYTYDGLGRLKSEAETGAPAVSYTYDDANNRKTLTVANTSQTAYTYDRNNRLLTEVKQEGSSISTTHYLYDNNGNQISTGVNLNQYDGFNQLIQVQSGAITASYTYNGQGLRTSKTVNGTTQKHVWDGQNMVLELRGGTVVNKYIRGINLIYSQLEGNTEKVYYLYNGHGDVVQLTNGSGAVTRSYAYDAFGNEIINNVGLFEASGQNTKSVVQVMRPDTKKLVKALKLEKGARVPTLVSIGLNLKSNKSYIIEFDYWTDSGAVAFDCDLYPDDLPEIHPVATTTVQHYRWEINSSSTNMEKAVLRFFNDLNIPNPENIYIADISIRENLVGGSTEIGVFEKANKTGTSIVDIVKPDSGKTVKAIRLNSGSNIPTIWTDALNLTPYETYVVEFDYWIESGEVVFDCDLYPDDLPQVFPVANTTVQHYKWEMSSSSSNMANAKLRFFNDLKATNPSHIYITNIKLYVKSTESKDSNPYRYSGEYFDKETGSIYLRARYYDPGIGRFISEDSFLGNNSDPLSLNLYTYCYNNPLTFIDPSGHEGATLTWTSTMWWLTATDGPIPLGDLIYLLGIAGTAAYDYGPVVVNWLGTQGAAAWNTLSNFADNAGDKVSEGSKKVRDLLKEKVGGGSGSPDPNKFNRFKESSKVDLDVKPEVSNEKLKNIINDLYKGQGGQKTIGNGTTMDAVRNELQTGLPTNGKFHTQKLNEYLNALQRRLRVGDLNDYDKSVVDALIDDMINALSGK